MKRFTATVDVGGSFTRVIVQDEWQHVVKNISFTASANTLKTQIQTALLPYGKPQKLVLGLRGVWTPTERTRWKKIFGHMGKSVLIMSDVELAHHLVFKNMAGVLLNAGTGSIALGRSPKGKMARAGGLGPLLGDEGSGFWIGRQYLKKVYKSEHNLDLVRPFAKDADPVQKIASLAKSVIEKTYRKKLPAEIIREAQKHLLALVEDVVAQLDWKGLVPLKLVGGLFHNTDFKRSFIRNLPQTRFRPF